MSSGFVGTNPRFCSHFCFCWNQCTNLIPTSSYFCCHVLLLESFCTTFCYNGFGFLLLPHYHFVTSFIMRLPNPGDCVVLQPLYYQRSPELETEPVFAGTGKHKSYNRWSILLQPSVIFFVTTGDVFCDYRQYFLLHPFNVVFLLVVVDRAIPAASVDDGRRRRCYIHGASMAGVATDLRRSCNQVEGELHEGGCEAPGASRRGVVGRRVRPL